MKIKDLLKSKKLQFYNITQRKMNKYHRHKMKLIKKTKMNKNSLRTKTIIQNKKASHNKKANK